MARELRWRQDCPGWWRISFLNTYPGGLPMAAGGRRMRTQNQMLKTMNKAPTSLFRHINALLVTIFYVQVMLGCGPSPCPTKEIAERIASQLINREYSDEMYNIDLETKRIFMKQIGKEKYCVYEFYYNATLKPYYLRYEKLERPGYKTGLQIAYLQREEGWYGTIVQTSE
jgi:hypothetical protein